MKKIWRIFKRLLVINIILGLIASNVLTLINDNIHATAFNVLKTVIASLVADKTLAHILSNSPTTKKYKAIEELKLVSVKRANTAKIISKRVASRAEKHAFQSFKSFFPKIVPWAGIAVTAIFTISDIMDDCQTLRDLNELNIDFELDKTNEATVCGMDISILKGYTDE